MPNSFILSPGVFNSIYDGGLTSLPMKDDRFFQSGINDSQTVLFSDSKTKRNFLAYIESVTTISDRTERSHGYKLVHLGRILPDAVIFDDTDEDHAPHLPKTLAYYKHLNGIGRWIEFEGNPEAIPGMVIRAEEDGNLLLAQKAKAIRLHNFQPRPGMWRYLENDELTRNPGQYKNYYTTTFK